MVNMEEVEKALNFNWFKEKVITEEDIRYFCEKDSIETVIVNNMRTDWRDQEEYHKTKSLAPCSKLEYTYADPSKREIKVVSERNAPYERYTDIGNKIAEIPNLDTITNVKKSITLHKQMKKALVDLQGLAYEQLLAMHHFMNTYSFVDIDTYQAEYDMEEIEDFAHGVTIEVVNERIEELKEMLPELLEKKEKKNLENKKKKLRKEKERIERELTQLN